MMIQLGLTGGIGSGKSTVARLLQRLGASVIDADAISRQSTASGGAAMAEVARVFGTGFITVDGSMERAAMRKLIFDDPAAKTRLEAIVHPVVSREVALQAALAQRSGAPLLVFDIPLLVESGHWRAKLDHVLVIDCSQETQILRVMQRSQWPRDQVLQTLAAQASRAQRLAAADSVICNDNIDLATLAQQVGEIARRFGL